MAHPFRYFRKHQKAFLAVAAVVAMFVFVVGDAIFGYIGQSGGPDPNKVVASWKGGRLTAMELETLTQRRYFLSRFLQMLMMKGAQRLIDEGGNPMQPSVPNFILNEGSTPYDVGVNVVSTRILADQARKAGITISDDVINYYLKEVSFRRVSDGEIVNMLQQVRGGDVRGAEEQLFSGLRELLLGHSFMTSYSANIRNVLPEQRWEDWRRINERISLEAAAVATSDFIKEVPDPKESELLSFYEEFKDKIGHQKYLVMGTELQSAEPGFKRPRRVKLSYLLGDVNAWAEKYKDSITEEEIADYYERNKRTQFVKTGDSPIFDESLFDTEEPAETPADEPANEAPATENSEAGSENATPATEEPSESETPAEAPAQTDGESTSEAPASENSAPAEETGEDAAPASDAETPEDSQSGSMNRQARFRLAAFQNNNENAADEIADDAADLAEGVAAEDEETADETAENEAPAESTSDASAEETPAAETPAADSTSTEAAPAPTEGTEAAGEESTADAAPASEAATDVAPASDSEASTTEAEEPVEYIPLDEVREEIRMTLARDKAVVELRKVMDKAYAEMQSAYTEYNLAKFSQGSSESGEKAAPAPSEALTNLKGRAAETGLASEETVLLTRTELADTAVGKAADVQTQTRPVWYAAFDDLALYQPVLSQDIDGNLYLVTKVEDVPEEVPAFKDIREEVAREWKLREAAKLALKKAEELAAEAEKAGDTLASFFIGKPYQVITTDMFSYLTFGTTPAELQRGAKLGDAPPLENVGPDFMEKAFELKDGEVAAFLNYDQSQAYVFRLDRRESTPEELRSLFLREANNWYGGQVMMLSRLQYQQQQVLEEVLKRVDFDEEQLQEFLRPSDQSEE